MWREANSLFKEFVVAWSLPKEEEKDQMFKELTAREEAFSKAAQAKKNVLNRSFSGPEENFVWSISCMATLLRANMQLHFFSICLSPVFSFQ